MLRQKYSRKKRREKFKNKTKKKYRGGGPGRTRASTGRKKREKREKEQKMMKENEEIMERLNREAGIATSKQNEEAMQKLLEDSSSSSQTSASLPTTSSLVREMDALLEPIPIKCRRGDNSKDCDGKQGAKKKKEARKDCRRKKGKVVKKNSKNEACELKMRPIGVNCPPGSERDKHCEKVFGSKLPCRSTEDPRKCLAQPDRLAKSGVTEATLMAYNNREGELDRYKIDKRRQKPPPIDRYSKENRGNMPMKDPSLIASQPLPEGWTKHFDDATGINYYVNNHSGESQWEKPTSPAVPEQADISSSGSVQATVAQLENREATKDEPLSTGLTKNSQCALMKSGDVRYAAEVHDEDGDGEVEYTGRSAAAPSDPMCNKPPPSGWDQDTDEATGKIYYYNSTTGEKSWTYPEQISTPASKVQSTVAQLENRDSSEAAAVAKKLTPNSQCAVIKKGSISYVAEVNEGEKGELDYTGEVASSASSDLCNKSTPSGWEQATDENTGKIYYYNSTTGESSWTLPRLTGSSKSTASDSANPTSPNAGPVAAAAAATAAPVVSSTSKKSKKQIIFELNYEKTFQYVLQSLRP